MKKELSVDTNFGLGNFDYTFCTKEELKERLFYEKRVERDIDIRFENMIRHSLYYYGPVKKQKIKLLTNEVGYYMLECGGPDQSYYSEKGEYNSIEIYKSILKIMWNDHLSHNFIKKIIRIRKLVRKKIKGDIKNAFNILKAYNNDRYINIYAYISAALLIVYLYYFKI